METITLRKSVYQINKILERKEEYLEYCKGVIKENDEKLALIISEKKDTINANRLIKIEMMKAKREIKKKHKNEKGSKDGERGVRYRYHQKALKANNIRIKMSEALAHELERHIIKAERKIRIFENDLEDGKKYLRERKDDQLFKLKGLRSERL